jgi:hypothetical protein
MEMTDTWKFYNNHLLTRTGCGYIVQQPHSSWLYPGPSVFAFMFCSISSRYKLLLEKEQMLSPDIPRFQ